MSDVIKAIEEMTERDIILYFWIDITTLSDAQSVFLRGRRRSMDEGITLCGGDVRRYMEYLRSETCSNG